MHDLIASLKNLLAGIGYGPLSIALSALVGVLSAVASSCCTLPVVGALVSSSIARREERRTALRTAILFMAGTIIALLLIGGVVVFAGQTIPRPAGSYGKIAAGCAALLFGIGALDLFPFTLPQLKLRHSKPSTPGIASWISGIVFGGAIVITSLPCNPGVFIILGASVLQKHLLWALLSLLAYAVGFSAPLAAVVYGFTLGAASIRLQKAEKFVRLLAGVALIAAGIYLLYTS